MEETDGRSLAPAVTKGDWSIETFCEVSLGGGEMSWLRASSGNRSFILLNLVFRLRSALRNLLTELARARSDMIEVRSNVLAGSHLFLSLSKTLIEINLFRTVIVLGMYPGLRATW